MCVSPLQRLKNVQKIQIILEKIEFICYNLYTKIYLGKGEPL